MILASDPTKISEQMDEQYNLKTQLNLWNFGRVVKQDVQVFKDVA